MMRLEILLQANLQMSSPYPKGVSHTSPGLRRYAVLRRYLGHASANPTTLKAVASSCSTLFETPIFLYSSPLSPGALKVSWLLLIRTMESALGVQVLRSDPVQYCSATEMFP